ncbi:MAG: formylglycine-generating enzyme family protein [Planctomycetes bacterium]|nr:formylglycine-generating enzyme family protein [Planctomycetota bacterium]
MSRSCCGGTLLMLGLTLAGGCDRRPRADHDRPAVPTKSVESVMAAALTNSIGMRLRLVPAGTFMMGSAESCEALVIVFPGTSPGWFLNEYPRHEVHITRPFYLGETEVTREQYQAVMGEHSHGSSTAEGNRGEVEAVGAVGLPVCGISWDEAVEFCRRLSAKEGHTYRLPTEAEWEYACRAGSEALFCFGDDASRLGDFAWFAENSDWKTQRVGGKEANAWHLRDMHGNVWEWCHDWYGEYSGGTATDPQGPSAGSLRVVRSGGWFREAWSCRSAYRDRFVPSGRNDFLGFRVARSVP